MLRKVVKQKKQFVNVWQITYDYAILLQIIIFFNLQHYKTFKQQRFAY